MRTTKSFPRNAVLMANLRSPAIGNFANVCRTSLAGGLLSLILLGATACLVGIRQSPQPTATVPEFTSNIRQLEKLRDAIVEDYQVVTANLNNMGTQEVFDRADNMVDGLTALRDDLVALTGSPITAPTKALFLAAYDAELEGYEAFADEVRRGFINPEGILAVIDQFLVADNIYRDAYDILEQLE